MNKFKDRFDRQRHCFMATNLKQLKLYVCHVENDHCHTSRSDTEIFSQLKSLLIITTDHVT